MLGEVAKEPSVGTPEALLFAEQTVISIGPRMSEKIPYHRKASEAIKAALDTFHSLSEALRAKVHALGEKFDKTDIDTGQLTKEILAHQGAWRMVQDALAKFKEDDREKGGVGKDGIDFASARDEVLSRIARLAPKRAG